MTDNISKEKRAWVMSRVCSKNTTPEKKVRSFIHRLGYRFSLHNADLPGKPDIVLKKYKTAIFVHGCFWHRHKNCDRNRTPKSNVDFWNEKFAKNINRDRWNRKELKNYGWRIIIIWECQVENENILRKKLLEKLPKNKNYNIQFHKHVLKAAEERERYK